jgi:hypothetical protein
MAVKFFEAVPIDEFSCEKFCQVLAKTISLHFENKNIFLESLPLSR